MSWADFDRYCDEQEAAGSTAEVHDLFAQWLADCTGRAIMGGPVGEPPTVIAIPDEAT
jgi:hypothetical protein